MRLLTVIPIARGVFRDTLSYWSGKDVTPGTIVTISVRSRDIPALVVSSEDLGEAKAGIKNASFSLKKIKNIKPALFLPEFVSAAKKTADYFASPAGGILQSFSPKPIIESLSRGTVQFSPSGKQTKAEKFVVQLEDEARFSAYKSLIREEFARGTSLFICLPTIESVRRATEELGRGISEYVFSFDSSLPSKELLSRWKKALLEKHPVVVLSTPAFISLPRTDIRTIVVDEESSRAYSSIGRPEFDFRVFFEIYAAERGAKFILGGEMLRAETIFRYQEKEFLEFTAVKFRLAGASGNVVSMTRAEGAGEPFFAVSKELLALIELSRREHGRVALIVGRRGLHSITVCRDCGTLVLCDPKKGGCGSPLVLHENKKSRFFLCHKCGKRKEILRDGEEKCQVCGGWRFVALGVGIARVEEEIKKAFPGLPVFRVDSDTTKTERAVRETVAEFYVAKNSVILGTEMLLPHLDKPVLGSAVLGIDSLLSLPDFRINEKIFSLILNLRAKTQKTILVQTQATERKFFEEAVKGDLGSFYKNELDERKALGYPPFSVLIRIRWETKANLAEKETGVILGRIGGFWEARGYLPPRAESGPSVEAHVLIKIPRGKWVDKKLLEFLKNLPPRYEVSVNPDSVL